MGVEIERKFLIKQLPENLETYPYHEITQAYLCTDPVIRIRKQDDEYYLTYKGKGLLCREEYNLPLNKDAYEHMLTKSDGNVISKKRYKLPLSNEEINEECLQALNGSELTLELDIFDAPFSPLILVEIEFPNQEAAEAFKMLSWFSEDVTENKEYHNSNMSKQRF